MYMPRIALMIVSSALEIDAEWEDLTKRAPANVFMHPAALNAVGTLQGARIHTLLAWDETVTPRKLVGLWSLQARRVAPLCPAFLTAPPHDYAFLSNPVVDPAFSSDVIPAFFAAIRNDPLLPNVVRLKYLDGDCATYDQIRDAITSRGGPVLTLSQSARPFVTRAIGLKLSGSTRKKLRQDWNKLAKLGTVDIVNERGPAAVRDAFEVFLALEAGSWKGAHGTALLCDERHAAFARRLIDGLTARGNASVAVLRIDAVPIAAQVLLYCGAMAYTWKTAFSADYAHCSPGALLVDKVTEQLFASGEVGAIESCSPEGGFMAQLWAGRRATVDMVLDVGSRKSISFRVVVLAARGFAWARTLRNRLRGMAWLPEWAPRRSNSRAAPLPSGSEISKQPVA
jgi:CelD/BcsL family acetyltransferase involved in cellulose biosynthesis